MHRGRISRILVALLLPVPLMVVIAINWIAPLTKLASEQGGAVVPMLSWEERRQRSTWRQPCQRSNDCDAPLACFFDRRVRGLYCTDSECATDAQCKEGFV